MARRPRILVVDDHVEIRNSVARYLSRNDMDVATANNAAQMDRQIETYHPDLIVLDVMMPGEDGLSACTRISDSGGPAVLLLTALDSEADLLHGFETGADDFMSKPFNPPELLARIRAILRRTQVDHTAGELAGKRLRIGEVIYDVDARTVQRADGQTAILTSGEASLFTILIGRARKTVSRDELLLSSTGRLSGPYDRTIDNRVSRLRKKIEPDVLRPRLIATVRNGGYMLSCEIEQLP